VSVSATGWEIRASATCCLRKKRKRHGETSHGNLKVRSLSQRTRIHLPAPILAVRAADSIVFDDQMDFAVSAELYCHCTRAVLEKRICQGFRNQLIGDDPIGTALCD
jgi:hypothetical protein